MSKIQKIQIIILFFAFCFLFSSNSVKAAKLDLISEIQEIGIGQQFQVDLILDTENEEINAVEGKVIFSEDLLELREIKDGSSIVNFWVERPKIKSDSQIVFSGIIPGGYMGKKGLIFSAVFQAKNERKGTIKIQEAKTLLNDGKGTSASLEISNFQFLIFKQIPISQIPISEIKDTDLPEDFKPEITRDPGMFEGKWFLVFAAQDKGSGIDHYEILEKGQKGSLQRLIREEKWQTGESPYLLKDQELKSYIYVKAIDKAGNERIATLSSQNPLKWYESWINWVIIIMGIVIIFYVIKRFLWRK